MKGESILLKTILVPVDGSTTSFKALKYAVNLCKDCGSKLVVSTVVFPYIFSDASNLRNSEMAVLVSPQIPPKSKDAAGDLVEDCGKERVLAIAKKKLAKEKELEIEYRCIISEDPAKSIVEQAAALKADTIVMGNRGMGQFAEILLGSVGNKVISFAKCPVVIVK